MSQAQDIFIASIPEHYDRFMVPLFFEPYARDLAQRVPQIAAGNVLELACGTGILTRILRERLPAPVRVVASDVSLGMIEYAQRKHAAQGGLDWRVIDATALPFADNMFEVVVCQFGVMFFSDRRRAFSEALRVLVPGGILLFNIWGRIEDNELSYMADEAARAHFPLDPPDFYRSVVFGCHDARAIVSQLKAVGFHKRRFEQIQLPGSAPSANDAARALIQGTPLYSQIASRDAHAVEIIVSNLTDIYVNKFGNAQIPSKTSAFVIHARKPQ